MNTEDLLSYLPRTAEQTYRKGDIIAAPERPCEAISLIISGCVALSFSHLTGGVSVLDFLASDGIFNEGSILGDYSVTATALVPTKVMMWPLSLFSRIASAKPQAAIALAQVVAARLRETERRAHWLATGLIGARMNHGIATLARKLGRDVDGYVDLPAVSQWMLAGYIGSTREVVTQKMNAMRKEGLLEYDRQRIRILRPDLFGLEAKAAA